jgi:hypothetical protein
VDLKGKNWNLNSKIVISLASENVGLAIKIATNEDFTIKHVDLTSKQCRYNQQKLGVEQYN